MSIVTLLEKVYNPFPPDLFEPFFSSLCEGLKVRLRVVGKTSRGWIQVDVSGEDKDVAVRLLDQKVGLAPVSVNNLKKFSLLKGKTVSSKMGEDNLRVDIGVFSPRLIDATIPLQTLQAQIANGKSFSLKQLIDLFCLYVNLPLEVKAVSDVSSESDSIEAALSEAQLSQITRWLHSYLDRLIVLGATFSDVEAAIERSRHVRDVIKIESLGLLEHAVLCKLGTEAKGLMPRLGPMLPHALLAPFSPRKIRQFVKRPFL
jgi:hypothetical protein